MQASHTHTHTAIPTRTCIVGGGGARVQYNIRNTSTQPFGHLGSYCSDTIFDKALPINKYVRPAVIKLAFLRSSDTFKKVRVILWNIEIFHLSIIAFQCNMS